MRPTIVTLRVNRRAVAVARLVDEGLALADGRHLTSHRESAVEAAGRYVEKLLDLSRPTHLVIDAPQATGDGVTAQILGRLEALAGRRGVSMLVMGKVDILRAFGVRPLASRVELRQLVRNYWPQLSGLTSRVEPYVVDAAAAALVADVRMVLEPGPT